MVREYEYEKGYYEYIDDEGFKRIGKWEQKYVGDRAYGSGDPLMNRKKVGFVDFYEDDDDEYVDGRPDPRHNCPNCLKYDMIVKLGPRIFPNGEKPPVDNDLFRQCHQCGEIYQLYEIEQQKMLKSDTERHTTNNQSEAKNSIVMGIPKRKLDMQRRNKQRAHHKDPEIDSLLRIYGEENIHIIQDTDP